MILALETSSAIASAAVVDESGRSLGESRPADGAHQARRLLDCVHEAVTTAGVALDELATVVCGLGPGTFTGLRIGVATARALAQATGLPVAGVPSLEALARGLAASGSGAHVDRVVPLIDGRRGEVFAAVYRRVSPEPSPAAASEPAAAFEPAAASEPAADPARAAGPGSAPALPQPWPDLELVVPLTVVAAAALPAFLEPWPGAVVGGDGALLYADRLPSAVAWERAVAAPSALMVGRTFLAGSPSLTLGFAATLPIYGREPDAVPRSSAAGRAALPPTDRPDR